MPESLDAAVAELRELLLDPALRRAVAAGRRRGAAAPTWRRAELRPVELKGGRRLQEVRYDERQAHTRNLAYGAEAAAGVDDLLAQPWGNWHVETDATIVQLRVTKKGQAQVHRRLRRAESEPARNERFALPSRLKPVDERSEEHRSPVVGNGAGTLAGTVAGNGTGPDAHDRAKPRLIDPGDPLFTVLGADASKRRQVDAFLRLLAPALAALAHRDPLHVVDLGCGNAYLSFAAHRYLGERARLTGVDVRADARLRNTEIAERLDIADTARFVAGTVADAVLPPGDLVLALHACDTATDDALARAVRWVAPVIVVAPCCHHETAAAIRGTVPGPYPAITRHGILRERLADVLTDGLRATLLRLLGYRVDVVEFVGSEHTARNVAIRAVHTGASPDVALLAQYRELTSSWGLAPRLAVLLADELTKRHEGVW